MATFAIHLMGHHQPITIDLPYRSIDELAEKAGSTRYLLGHMTAADEEGVCRRVMIATSRIQCAIDYCT